MTAPPPASNAVTAMPIRAHYYQQFDADSSLDVPAEAYGGGKEPALPSARDHPALVVMPAWACGPRQQSPGWPRCVKYIPRAERIAREVFPPILRAARETGFRVYHVVWGATGGPCA